MSLQLDKRLIVVVGNYGSGKTELSLNMALRLREQGKKTALVDLDIVNPYFRSGEQKDVLEAAGVRVLMPTFANTTVDIPALPAEIQSVFDGQTEHVVMDVGGDDTGAAALGRYAPYFAKEPENTEMLFVINCQRPLTQTAEDIIDLMARVTSRSRLEITGLINNTNAAGASDLDALLAGQRVAEQVSAQTGKPLRAISGEAALLAQLPENLKPLAFPLKRYMKPVWMEL